MGGSDEEKAGSSKKKQNDKKEKDIFRGKKGKSADNVDSDEEETFENMESKEVDYMSESSSEDELLEMDDEPDPEKKTLEKQKMISIYSWIRRTRKKKNSMKQARS